MYDNINDMDEKNNVFKLFLFHIDLFSFGADAVNVAVPLVSFGFIIAKLLP